MVGQYHTYFKGGVFLEDQFNICFPLVLNVHVDYNYTQID